MPSALDAVVPLIHKLSGSQEVLAVGTLIPDEAGTPVLHMHAAAGREGRATVGCTRAGVDVWLVGEVVVLEILGTDARRQKDPQTGFQLLTVGPEQPVFVFLYRVRTAYQHLHLLPSFPTCLPGKELIICRIKSPRSGGKPPWPRAR